MTKEAIQRAWDERKSADEYQNLADLTYSRSEADWLIGMNGSRIAEVFFQRSAQNEFHWVECKQQHWQFSSTTSLKF